METASTTLRQLPETIKQITSFSESLTNDIVNGNINPLEGDYLLHAFEECVARVRKNEEVKKAILSEVEKYSKSTFEYRDATIQVKTVSKYDYSQCSLWNDIKYQENELAERRKKLEAIMQNIDSPIADTDTGEMIYPAACESSKTIAYKFKK